MAAAAGDHRAAARIHLQLAEAHRRGGNRFGEVRALVDAALSGAEPACRLQELAAGNPSPLFTAAARVAAALAGEDLATLLDAVAGLGTVGAHRWADELGGRVWAQVAADSPSSARLTTRERRVAELAAAGFTNPDIAARRSVSRRTVENHLHRVYAKLGVSGREGLPGHVA
jgi:DNA-binding CsgD family transcriptional regulator